jgi:hypothetical protein
MKIRNEDLKALTEIKQYFLDPPHTFRLYSFAIPKAEEALKLVEKYPKLKPMQDSLYQAFTEIIELKDKPAELRKAMIAFGRLFSYMNGQ